MFDFSANVFKPAVSIPQWAKIIFVSDMFVEDYVGGAELTSEALIQACPLKLYKLHSRDVTTDLINQGHDRFWIFGNFTQVNPQLISQIASGLKYSVLEYDYKYCSHRSPEKHLAATGSPCDCQSQDHGKLVSAFYYAAANLWWMSKAQMDRYHKLFPFLAQKENVVLSSVFSSSTLDKIRNLRQTTTTKEGWIVLGSNSWIKGANAAEKWCIDNKKKYEVVWDMPYDQLLKKLASAEGFVYLPLGGDTCPRMVIEARLLRCDLQLNENVQHVREAWFTDNKLDNVDAYLRASPVRFWDGINQAMQRKVTISGYTTTYNCIKQQYPFEQCIQSMLAFCDEVCIVDGGSTDGTWETLSHMIMSEPKLVLKQVKRDWSHPRHAVFDGMQKAEARRLCTKAFCWQMDSDEVVHEDDVPKIRTMIDQIPSGINIVCLPVIEYWGGPSKVRMDVTPWKWRFSRNLPNITHGIPKTLRRTDANGDLYACEGTDGCDMIDAITHEPISHVSFYTPNADQARQAGLAGNETARREYEGWFNAVVTVLPGVHHYSWYDIERKIRLYRDYWQQHWLSLYDKKVDDTAENNMFFDCPWVSVTDEMIKQRAEQLATGTGGHIFHTKWNGQATPSIVCTRSQPKWMMSK